MTRSHLTALIILSLLPVTAGAAEPSIGFQKTVAPFLKAHCAACHAGGKAQGGFSLDRLDPRAVGGKDAETWLRLAERIDTGEMPPDDQPRPRPEAVQAVVGWLTAELRRSGHDTGELGSGPTGNHLDHDLLFSGRATAPLNNPPRLWRFSPEIYAVWVLRKGTTTNTEGQAMTPPGDEGFKDRSANLTIDEGTLAVVLRNAQSLAKNRTEHTIANGKLLSSKSLGAGVAAVLDPSRTPTRTEIENAINGFAFYRRWGRFSGEELDRLVQLYEKASQAGDRAAGLRAVFVAIQLRPESLYRLEFGLGPADARGYRMLGPRELAYALSFAFGDQLERDLADKAAKGQLRSRDDVAREVGQRVKRPTHQNPRILRFFREYFGYDQAPTVFKDNAAAQNHHAPTLVHDTDLLIEFLLETDQDVFRQLLTTTKSFVAAKIDKNGQATRAVPKIAVHKNYGLDDWPARQPVDLPAHQRAGILTQPSWLVAQSGNFDNHPVQRGKWIRERLLGGTVPPIPITVNAQVPDDDTRTLRDRLVEVTRPAFCTQCHQRMNNLGLPFEQFDHFGRFRTTIALRDPTRPIVAPSNPKNKKEKPRPAMKDVPAVADGAISRSGDATLDGEVAHSIQMLHKLANSPRARQVFVRYAFRYWMGREENLGDASTLIAADKAFVESGGSMKALIASLLTSDSFLYRTPPMSDARSRE